jgi:hypothetical protein
MLLPALLPTLLAATLEVAPGGDLHAAVAAARPGDTVRLPAGSLAGSLGRVRGPLRIAGAGAGVTIVDAPEGEDGLVVEADGDVRLEGFTLRAHGPRAALKVLGGNVQARSVALVGGSVGAFVGGGTLEASDVDLSGDFGALLQSGDLTLTGSRARGGHAGIAQLGGRATIGRVAVTGPSTEAAVSISGGVASLLELVIRAPGPTGLSVLGGAQVSARSVEVSGAASSGDFLGDCVQVRRGTLSLAGGTLTHCGGAAIEAMGGSVDARGLDAAGGEAGCLVFLEHASGRLDGNRCTRNGPGVVAASGAQVAASMNRWMVDPVLWVECGSGARVYLGVGETSREPCGKSGSSLDKPVKK